jgi:hypothetical protein
VGLQRGVLLAQSVGLGSWVRSCVAWVSLAVGHVLRSRRRRAMVEWARGSLLRRLGVVLLCALVD